MKYLLPLPVFTPLLILTKKPSHDSPQTFLGHEIVVHGFTGMKSKPIDDKLRFVNGTMDLLSPDPSLPMHTTKFTVYAISITFFLKKSKGNLSVIMITAFVFIMA